MRVGDEIANLGLGVEHAVRSHSSELGKLLALDAEALVIGEMPVQDVHFDGGHAVEIALEHIDGNEVAADIDEQAAPGKAGLIFDGDSGSSKSGWRDLYELKKCLQSAQDAKRRRRGELSAGIGDGQFVGFVFTELLHGLAAVVGVDLQRWRGARHGTERDSSLARKLYLESLDFAVERGVVSAADYNRE